MGEREGIRFKTPSQHSQETNQCVGVRLEDWVCGGRGHGGAWRCTIQTPSQYTQKMGQCRCTPS
jgi:hypothetical protein